MVKNPPHASLLYLAHQVMNKCGRSVAMTDEYIVYTCSNGINIHKYDAVNKVWPTATSSFTHGNSVYTYVTPFQTFYYCKLSVHSGAEALNWDCNNFQTARFADAVVTAHKKWIALAYGSLDDEMVRGVQIYLYTSPTKKFKFNYQIRAKEHIGTGQYGNVPSRFGTDVAMNDNVLVVGTQRDGPYVFTWDPNLGWNRDWVNKLSRIENNQKPSRGSVSAWGAGE